MEAPPAVKEILEFAASQVLRLTDQNFFIGDTAMDPVELCESPTITLLKTGGTTGHKQQGDNYIHYVLEIPSLKQKKPFSIYVKPASSHPVANRAALARAIMWFISCYGKGTIYTRDVCYPSPTVNSGFEPNAKIYGSNVAKLVVDGTVCW